MIFGEWFWFFMKLVQCLFLHVLTRMFFSRSPGKIVSVSVPTFEALSQSGVATITTKNTGEVEASYSLTVVCCSTFPIKVPHLSAIRLRLC